MKRSSKGNSFARGFEWKNVLLYSQLLYNTLVAHQVPNAILRIFLKTFFMEHVRPRLTANSFTTTMVGQGTLQELPLKPKVRYKGSWYYSLSTLIISIIFKVYPPTPISLLYHVCAPLARSSMVQTVRSLEPFHCVAWSPKASSVKLREMYWLSVIGLQWEGCCRMARNPPPHPCFWHNPQMWIWPKIRNWNDILAVNNRHQQK